MKQTDFNSGLLEERSIRRKVLRKLNKKPILYSQLRARFKYFYPNSDLFQRGE